MDRERKRLRTGKGDAPGATGSSSSLGGSATATAAAPAASDGSLVKADTALQKTLSALQDIQSQLDRLDDEASLAILEIQRKTFQIQRPLYDQRDTIAANVDGFWLTAMLGCPMLAPVVTQPDEMVLEYCTGIRVEDNQDQGWKITFDFSPNPFFSNTQLVKSCKATEDGTISFTCPTIRWADGQDVTAREDEVGSFFEWFNDTPGVSGGGGGWVDVGVGEGDEGDEGDSEGDYIGDVIVHILWPRALEHFLAGLGAVGE